MCLCKGTGGISKWHPWGITYDPCPDSNCQFDRQAADKIYEEWKRKTEAFYKNNGVA